MATSNLRTPATHNGCVWGRDGPSVGNKYGCVIQFCFCCAVLLVEECQTDTSAKQDGRARARMSNQNRKEKARDHEGRQGARRKSKQKIVQRCVCAGPVEDFLAIPRRASLALLSDPSSTRVSYIATFSSSCSANPIRIASLHYAHGVIKEEWRPKKVYNDASVSIDRNFLKNSAIYAHPKRTSWKATQIIVPLDMTPLWFKQ